MKYYLHDTNSFDDEKITELFINFGYEGLGLFYTALEKFAKQEKPIKTNVLKSQLKVGKRLEKCWEFLEETDLISSNNGESFNKQLLNFSEKFTIKKEKNKKRISEWRRNQEDAENVTRYESVRNTYKDKISKVKEREEEEEEEDKTSTSTLINTLIDSKNCNEVLKKLKNDETFIDVLAKNNYKENRDIYILLDKFVFDNSGMHKTWANETDMRQHFRAWLPMHLLKNKPAISEPKRRVYE